MATGAGDAFRCGTVAIVGRPNVGKSTYLNQAVGQKISITSRKPQTTRYRILGIKTLPGAQIVYIDTPGLDTRQGRGLTRAMNREVGRVLGEVDVVVLMVEALKWTAGDQAVLDLVTQSRRTPVVAVNKVDTVKEKKQLLPYLASLGERVPGAELVPLSGRSGANCAALEACIVVRLPEGPPMFGEDEVTDRSARFLAGEIVREKLMRLLGDEVPYSLGVVIDHYAEKPGAVHIAATIWVEREGQKAIVVGKGGSVLKAVGEKARKDLEEMLGCKVFLETWVKVKERWTENAQSLRLMGFDS